MSKYLLLPELSRSKGKVKFCKSKYSISEITQSWGEDGQGHYDAVERKSPWCIIIKCDLSQAINICAWFLSTFSMPTCTHYDNKTLSINCGEAGSGAEYLYDRVEAFIEGYFYSIITKE